MRRLRTLIVAHVLEIGVESLPPATADTTERCDLSLGRESVDDAIQPLDDVPTRTCMFLQNEAIMTTKDDGWTT